MVGSPRRPPPARSPRVSGPVALVALVALPARGVVRASTPPDSPPPPDAAAWIRAFPAPARSPGCAAGGRGGGAGRRHRHGVHAAGPVPPNLDSRPRRWVGQPSVRPVVAVAVRRR